MINNNNQIHQIIMFNSMDGMELEQEQINKKKYIEIVGNIFIEKTRYFPLSSRGIIICVLKLPVRLIQSLKIGFKAKENNLGFKQKFNESMQKYLKLDWIGGICDRYTRLESSEDNKTREIAQKYIVYADLNSKENGYTRSTQSNPLLDIKKLIKNFGFKIDPNSGWFFSKVTMSGIRIYFNESKQEFVLSFAGMTGQEDKIKQEFQYVCENFLGKIDEASLEAIRLGEVLKNYCNNNKIKFRIVGHSHGGCLAQCVGAYHGVKTIVFNSQPMGAGLRRYIGQKKIAKNAKKITAFCVIGDFLGGTRVFNVFSATMERLSGIIFPRTVAGNAYLIPNVHKNYENMLSIDNHNAVYHSLKFLSEGKWPDYCFEYKRKL